MYILVGSAKHGVFLDGDFAGRFLWYLYYVPQIFATFLAFIIAFRVGKKEEYRLPGVFNYLFVVGVFFVIGYLQTIYISWPSLLILILWPGISSMAGALVSMFLQRGYTFSLLQALLCFP
jgi:hypothetical protein